MKVVGYQNCTLKLQGYNFFVPTFEAVGENQVIDLQDIKVIGGTGAMTENIVVYDKDARATGTFYNWITSEATGGFYETGWYNSSFQKVTSVTLPRGVGLYFYCPTPGAMLQFSGQVSKGEQINDLINLGYNIIGNSTPVEIDLQQISLVGGSGAMTENIVVYDKDARATGTFYNWITSEATGGFYETGWYNSSFQKVTGIKVQPGEGLYLFCTTPNVKYKLPAALAE